MNQITKFYKKIKEEVNKDDVNNPSLIQGIYYGIWLFVIIPILIMLFFDL